MTLKFFTFSHGHKMTVGVPVTERTLKAGRRGKGNLGPVSAFIWKPFPELATGFFYASLIKVSHGQTLAPREFGPKTAAKSLLCSTSNKGYGLTGGL